MRITALNDWKTVFDLRIGCVFSTHGYVLVIRVSVPTVVYLRTICRSKSAGPSIY